MGVIFRRKNSWTTCTRSAPANPDECVFEGQTHAIAVGSRIVEIRNAASG